MNRILIVLVSASIAVLSGCGAIPKSPKEFRDAAADMVAPEIFTVSRSLDAVTESFRRQSERCLDVTVSSTTVQGPRVIASRYDYVGSVYPTAERTELHLQQQVGTMGLFEMPEGGYYVFIADAVRETSNRTRIELYRPDYGFQNVAQAVRGWAGGTSTGCPDLSQAF